MFAYRQKNILVVHKPYVKMVWKLYIKSLNKRKCTQIVYKRVRGDGMEANRIYTVKARLTPEEYKRFNEHVQGSSRPKNKSNYIRECIFSEDIQKSTAVAKELKNLNFQIRKIGVLINQIAASANRGVWYPGDTELVLRKLQEVEEPVERFKEDLKEL